jgi:Fibrobacter succinogenes major domain (Fib_succ_major)/WG containing repeat
MQIINMSNFSKRFFHYLLSGILFLLPLITTAQYVSPNNADGTRKSSADIKLEESKNRQNNSVPATSGGSGGGGTFFGGSKGGHRRNAREAEKKMEADNREGLAILSRYSYVGWPDANKLMAVRLNNKWGYVTRNGKYVYERIPVIYDELGFAQRNMYGVRLGNKWGYVNMYGNVLIPIEYDSLVQSFGNSNSVLRTSKVVKDGKIFDIDLQGKVVGRKTDIATGKMDPEELSTTSAKTNDIPAPPKKIIPAARLKDHVWMTGNLNVSHFANGDAIPEAKTIQEWEMAGLNGKPAWSYYNNDPQNGATYGKLYNWYAVSDSRGLAPAGYRIPDAGDWQVQGEGSKYKIAYVSKMAGERYIKEFKAQGKFGGYWTSTPSPSFQTEAMYYTNDGDDGSVDKATGLSVRCIKKKFPL